MNVKNFLKASLSIALALVLAAGSSVNVLAASSNYVSEVVTYPASSYEEAKKGLEAFGYTIVKDSNLNSTLETGVYLGYKTTTNKDEAITDIAAMNMNGPYSYSDYEKILDKQRDEIMAQLEKLAPAIAAFQESYNEGRASGKIVYATLNQYYDDDTNKDIGDIFLEYDFSDEKKAELCEMLLQGCSNTVLNIIQTLALTAGYSDGTSVIDYMQELGFDGVYEAYLKEYKRNSQKAMRAMITELSSKAIAALREWNDLYNTLCDVEQYIEFNGDELNINIPDTEDMIDAAEVAALMENINLYLKLKNTVIDSESNMTALDYFKRPFDESMRSDLYLIAYVLTDAQAGLLTYISLSKLLSLDAYGLDAGAQDVEAVVASYAPSEKGYISIYDGIDRTYFEKGVAFTSEATKHESLTGESWSPAGSGVNWLATIIATSAISVACFAVGAGVLAYAKSANTAKYLPQINALKDKMSKASNSIYAVAEQQRVVTQARKEITSQMNAFLEAGGRFDDVRYINLENQSLAYYKTQRSLETQATKLHANNVVDEHQLNKLQTNYQKGVSTGMKAFSYVMFALAIVFLVLDILSIIKYFTTEVPEEANVPVHLVTALADGYGTTDYVYYNTVNDLSGNPGDLNNHEGDRANVGWLVLYYTKDKLAGDPITADKLKVQVGSSSISENTYGIHMFNEEAPANLTAEKYTSVADSVNGTYVLFERADYLAVGSAITSGQALIYLAIGLVVGALGGVVVSKKGSKKKEQVA